jgi:hypothetical protein
MDSCLNVRRASNPPVKETRRAGRGQGPAAEQSPWTVSRGKTAGETICVLGNPVMNPTRLWGE